MRNNKGVIHVFLYDEIYFFKTSVNNQNNQKISYFCLLVIIKYLWLFIVLINIFNF